MTITTSMYTLTWSTPGIVYYIIKPYSRVTIVTMRCTSYKGERIPTNLVKLRFTCIVTMVTLSTLSGYSI